MPLTFFAHQAPVLPLKIARPEAFDGTALCLGSMAPDLAYPLGSRLNEISHTPLGVVTWAVAFTVAGCLAVRRWVAPTAFAHLPDAGWLRLHSLRVLGRRRPPLRQTVVSGTVGAATHVFIDGFTHPERFGTRWLGLDRMFIDVPLLHRTMTVSHALQLAGHTVGSLLGLALLAHVGRRRLVERWYGTPAVRDARAFRIRPVQRVTFWSVVLGGLFVGRWWASVRPGIDAFPIIDSLAVATLLACLLPACRPALHAGAAASPGPSD